MFLNIFQASNIYNRNCQQTVDIWSFTLPRRGLFQIAGFGRSQSTICIFYPAIKISIQPGGAVELLLPNSVQHSAAAICKWVVSSSSLVLDKVNLTLDFSRGSLWQLCCLGCGGSAVRGVLNNELCVIGGCVDTKHSRSHGHGQDSSLNGITAWAHFQRVSGGDQPMSSMTRCSRSRFDNMALKCVSY